MARIEPVRVGVIGCGNISDIYLTNLKQYPHLDVIAVADLVALRAAEKANRYQIPEALSPEALLAHRDVELVVNLTTPDAHAPIALAAIDAGKHVYNEKPLTAHRESARTLLERAAARGLRVGGAPDTFLGGGLQTCRSAIDSGAIGQVVGASAFMLWHGHESWHPNPDFFYQPGAGPLLDMGPYYVTALVALLGGVRRVSGSARTTFSERTITSQPRRGEKIQVNTPTHITGTLDFADGAIATLTTSFDVWHDEVARIEIYGSAGTLRIPDPNTFGGVVMIWRAGAKAWDSMPITHGYTDNSRGLGVADMAFGIRSGRPHRASGDLAYHVLDVMMAIFDSSETGRHILLDSVVPRPEPLPTGELTS